MTAVLERKHTKAAKRARTNAKGDELVADLEFIIDSVDFFSAELSANYALTTGKWRRKALGAIHSHSFWIVARCVQGVLQLFERIRRFLQKHKELVAETGAGSIAYLVWGKVNVYMREFKKLADADPLSFLADVSA